MISQERFDEIELEYGCGYWNVCWEHACPCAITTENKGLQESIYKSLVEEAAEVANDLEDDDFEYEKQVRCGKCGCYENESELIDGMCEDCYDDWLDDCREDEED